MIKIEKADASDSEVLTEISKNAFNDSSRRFGNGLNSGPPGYDSVEASSNIISSKLTYKIIYDDKIAGWLFVTNLGNGNYELSNICIDPIYQNKGIGSKALELLEKTIRDAVKWRLVTVPYSKRNHHFYEKLGYVKIGLEDNYFFIYEKVPAS